MLSVQSSYFGGNCAIHDCVVNWQDVVLAQCQTNLQISTKDIHPMQMRIEVPQKLKSRHTNMSAPILMIF